MAKFEVLILPIDKVENHPNADRLSLNRIRGFTIVSNRLDDGSHRYQAGQLVAFIPENTVVPDSLLKARGYWDEKKGKGFLGGEKGNIVCPINLRGIVSRGLIFPTEPTGAETESGYNACPYIESGDKHKRMVRVGDDVAGFLGIKKNIRPGLWDCGTQLGLSINYELEDLKKFPGLLVGHQIIITELLHGVLCVVGYDRSLDDPFFVSPNVLMPNDNIRVSTTDIYTQTAKPIWEEIKRYLKEMPAVEKFYLFGEIIGPGIQDITYGLEATEFRALDIQMGLMGGGRDSIPFGFVGTRKYELFKWLNIASAPILWGGLYDPITVEELTNGPSSIGGGLRKGVVISSEDENFVDGRRPILKNISDKYLLRSKGTEYK